MTGKCLLGAGSASYTPRPMAPMAAMVRRSRMFSLEVRVRVLGGKVKGKGDVSGGDGG
jgi:hypothetical protein